MHDDSTGDIFETIYSTDLVYSPGCWKVCGDAHCCSFSRYKSKLVMIGKHPQELPLLPGEYEFLERKGWLAHFEPFQRRVIQYPLTDGVMKIEFIVGTGRTCACRHDTRTTTCRLYPLTPVFNLDGQLTGVDTRFGIFEELETLEGLPRACQVDNIPFAELGKFLTIAAAIGRSPTAVFYLSAYQIAKSHAVEQLRRALGSLQAGQQVPTFRMFEGLFALKRLFNPPELRGRLEDLASQFRQRYGSRFSLHPSTTPLPSDFK